MRNQPAQRQGTIGGIVPTAVVRNGPDIRHAKSTRGRRPRVLTSALDRVQSRFRGATDARIRVRQRLGQREDGIAGVRPDSA